MRKRLSASQQRAPDEEPMINLTPLIDVVFVILIMFIVIAPLLQHENIELAESPASEYSKAHSTSTASPIAIRVTSDNFITLNGERVCCEELTAKLQLLRNQYPQTTPQLFQDKRAQFGTYQKVKNATEASGFTAIDLILAPQ